MVFVVICTCGTVTVVTNDVVMLLPGHVRPEDTPVVNVAGMTTLEEYVMVVQGAGLPGVGAGAEVIGPALLGVYPAGDGPGVTVDGQAVMIAGLVET